MSLAKLLQLGSVQPHSIILSLLVSRNTLKLLLQLRFYLVVRFDISTYIFLLSQESQPPRFSISYLRITRVPFVAFKIHERGPQLKIRNRTTFKQLTTIHQIDHNLTLLLLISYKLIARNAEP